MNRRDVIIIAVLINAGLLVVLCASALKSGNNQVDVAIERSGAVHTPISMQNSHGSSPSGGDEVDQVLSQFATVHPVKQPSASLPIATPALPSLPDTTSPDMHNVFPSFSQGMPPLVPPQILSPSTTTSLPKKEEKSEGGFKEIRVKKGDALEKIAKAHHTTVQELMRINHLSSTQLKIGQVLKIPTKTISTQIASSPKTVADESKYYIVKNGDNPWTIAVKNHMKVDELLKLNGLDEEKARKLKPGDQLRIR